MTVSVVIPTYNEANVIGEALDSLKKQTHKDLEIIVVDDGSIDGTRLKLEGAKVITQNHKGPGPARNFGAKSAKEEILVFVDSDMTFEPDFIKRLVAPIEKGEVKGTFSKEEYVANPDNIWSQCWGINEGWEKGKRHPKNYPDKQKVFRAILKSEFDKAGGFSSTGYTDDWTLADKLGYGAEAAPGAKFYHKNPESLSEIFAQALWIGRREYKLGFVGKIVAILRSSLPISLLVGLVKALLNARPSFVVFKIVYDFGIFVGATGSLLGGKNAK